MANTQIDDGKSKNVKLDAIFGFAFAHTHTKFVQWSSKRKIIGPHKKAYISIINMSVWCLYVVVVVAVAAAFFIVDSFSSRVVFAPVSFEQQVFKRNKSPHINMSMSNTGSSSLYFLYTNSTHSNPLSQCAVVVLCAALSLSSFLIAIEKYTPRAGSTARLTVSLSKWMQKHIPS